MQSFFLSFSFLSFWLCTWYDSSSSPSLELLDSSLEDALEAFASCSFFFLASLLFLLASLLSLLSSFLAFFSSNRCCSFFFSLASLFPFLATLFLLSSTFWAFSASVASSYGSVELLAVEALSSLRSVSCSPTSSGSTLMGFTTLDPPQGSIPHTVKCTRGNRLWYHL